MTVLPGMTAIEDGLSCITEACSDLAAQRSMAISAWAMIGATLVSLIIGGVTLILVYTTFGTAARSAKAAEAAVSVAQVIGERQVRAYMSIGEARLVIDGLKFPAFILMLGNSGQSPARQVQVELAVAFHANGDETKIRLRRSVEDIPAQGSVTAHLPIGTNYFDIVGDSTMRLRLDISATYFDGFEKPDSAEAYFYLRPGKYADGIHLLNRAEKTVKTNDT